MSPLTKVHPVGGSIVQAASIIGPQEVPFIAPKVVFVNVITSFSQTGFGL